MISTNKLFALGAYMFILLSQCTPSKNISSKATPISHELWTEVLQEYVSEDGAVNYQGLKDSRVVFDQYIQLLENNHPNKKWSKDEQLAYWINAYNAFTIQIMIDNYPLKSIKDIADGLKIPFVSTTWDIKFINIEGYEYDLNNIEHGIIRKDFEEARIHFAVNCASKSCPKLLNEAFTAERLDEQLDQVARSFINNPLKNKISADNAELSSIFSWFRGDFTKSKEINNIRDFINQYSNTKINNDAKISYLDYDWTVNE